MDNLDQDQDRDKDQEAEEFLMDKLGLPCYRQIFWPVKSSSTSSNSDDPIIKDYRIICCHNCLADIGFQHVDFERLFFCKKDCVASCEFILDGLRKSPNGQEFYFNSKFWQKIYNIASESEDPIKKLTERWEELGIKVDQNKEEDEGVKSAVEDFSSDSDLDLEVCTSEEEKEAVSSPLENTILNEKLLNWARNGSSARK